MQLQQHRQSQQRKMVWQQALRHKGKLPQMQLHLLPHHQLEVQLKRWQLKRWLQRRQPQETHLERQQPLEA